MSLHVEGRDPRAHVPSSTVRVPSISARAPMLAAAIVLGSASVATATDWPGFAHDARNSNFANDPAAPTAAEAVHLRRAWETFNDDALVPGPPPSGFALEGALGLVYPASVVGVIGSPIVLDGVMYYVDELGTVFARDAATGSDAGLWTTELVDPDYEAGDPPIAPELYYTAPVVTDDHIWVVGSVYGGVHLLDRATGAELDFDPNTPEIDPLTLVPDRPVSSVLGDPVIVERNGRSLLVVAVNVIVNDAVFQGGETGLIVAYDVTDPMAPFELWRTATIDDDPKTGLPFGAGVSAGTGLAVDRKRGYIFGGTGQNTIEPYEGYPDPDLAPAGYVDRGDSIYCIDVDTGEFVWSNQFHVGDVFDLNDPVSTGPNNPDGPRDADVLAPPMLFSFRLQSRPGGFVGAGSKGGLYRVVDCETGETVWERQISQPTGIGGIQGGSAIADETIYVAGFEGIDDGFSDAQFGASFDTGIYPNAFFATFAPAFWADVEDTAEDGDPATGMRIKLYALNARTGESRWQFEDDIDYVELPAGASLRHVTATPELVLVTCSSGQLFVLDRETGEQLFHDQTADLNDVFDLGLGKPHHASMNGGSVVADGLIIAPFGAQNNPSGGVIAYEVNLPPLAADDVVPGSAGVVTVDALANDSDPNGDRLRFKSVGGVAVNREDGGPDIIALRDLTIVVFNPGDDPRQPEAAYLQVIFSGGVRGDRSFTYIVEDMAPNLIVNGVEQDEPNPTHTARTAEATITLRAK